MERFDYEQLYRETVPAVVSVYRDAGQRGAGSGFIYDDDHLLTNEHVVRDRERVDVRFHDGDWATGRVVGSDVYTDLAVVRVDDRPADATPLSIADEDAYPRPGQPVAALGNPLGLDGSVTSGIVSGVDRSMRTSGGFSIPDVVQTDAPINPGNSGGPLVAADVAGYPVVGVNRAKSGDNIGFAVSARVVSTVVPTLVAEGRYSHAYLQVSTLDVTPQVADANDLDEPHGVIVVEVREQTAGDDLRGSRYRRRVDGRAVPVGGDVILGMNGDPIRSHQELTRRLLTDATPGKPVTLDIVRNGRARTVETVPVERPVSADDQRRANGQTAIPLE